MVVAGLRGHALDLLDEIDHQLLHRLLGFLDALPQHALAVDHRAQVIAGTFQRGAIQRAGQYLPHVADLAVEPAAAVDQFGDVLQQQVEQVEQQVVLFVQHVVAYPDLVAEFAQVLLHRLQRLPGLPAVQFVAHAPGLGFQFRCLLQQAGQYRAEGVAQHVAQALGLAVAPGRRLQFDGADVLVDQLAQQAAIAFPLLAVAGTVQQPAEVAQLPGQAGHALGEGMQQRIGRMGVAEDPLQRRRAVAVRGGLVRRRARCRGFGHDLPA